MKKILMFLTLIVVLLTCLVACNTVSCKHDDPSQIVVVDAVAPTCRETGLTEGKKCNLCGTMVVPQAIDPVIDCIASDWIVDSEATHTEDGSKHTECTMCGRIVEEQTLLSGQNKMVYSLLPNNTYEVQVIGECSDNDIVIPSEYNGLPVTSIGENAFHFTGISSIVIPDSVTSIGKSAFEDCNSLSSIVIPDSVTSIADSAFYGCDGLTSVVIGDRVTSIGNEAFYNCANLSSVVIGDSVTSIGNWAFAFCYSLSSVVIPDSVTSIGDFAFSGCDSLSSVVIGDGVISIGYRAFDSCNSLSSVIIGDSVTSIGDWAFYGCISLSSVVIPDSVTSIGLYSFYRCNSLKDVYYMGSEEEWKAITISSVGNSDLLEATIHYNYIPEN